MLVSSFCKDSSFAEQSEFRAERVAQLGSTKLCETMSKCALKNSFKILIPTGIENVAQRTEDAWLAWPGRVGRKLNPAQHDGLLIQKRRHRRCHHRTFTKSAVCIEDKLG
jgi:hypothetical protein